MFSRPEPPGATQRERESMQMVRWLVNQTDTTQGWRRGRPQITGLDVFSLMEQRRHEERRRRDDDGVCGRSDGGHRGAGRVDQSSPASTRLPSGASQLKFVCAAEPSPPIHPPYGTGDTHTDRRTHKPYRAVSPAGSLWDSEERQRRAFETAAAAAAASDRYADSRPTRGGVVPYRAAASLPAFCSPASPRH